MISKNDVIIEKNDNDYVITTGYQYYEEFFISKSKTKGTRVKQFYIDAISLLVSENAIVTYEYENVFVVKNKINNYLVGSIVGVIGVSLSLVYYLYLDNEIKEVQYDNINLFKTPFHKNYWKETTKFWNQHLINN